MDCRPELWLTGYAGKPSCLPCLKRNTAGICKRSGNSFHRYLIFICMKMTLKQLILCAYLAVLGMLVKPFLSPVFNMLTDFIRIPGGSVTAGISILFLVFGRVLINRPYTGLLIGFLQGVISLTTGISATVGALVLITYTLPGIAVDLVIGRTHQPLMIRMVLAGACGVLAGAVSTNMLYFRMSLLPFILFYTFGVLSGGVGGYLAYQAVIRIPERFRKEFQ